MRSDILIKLAGSVIIALIAIAILLFAKGRLPLRLSDKQARYLFIGTACVVLLVYFGVRITRYYLLYWR